MAGQSCCSFTATARTEATRSHSGQGQGGLRAAAAADQQGESPSVECNARPALTRYPVRRIHFRRIHSFKPKPVEQVQQLEKEPLLLLYSRLHTFAVEQTSRLDSTNKNLDYYIGCYQATKSELQATISKAETYKDQATDHYIKWELESKRVTAFRDAFDHEVTLHNTTSQDLQRTRSDLLEARDKWEDQDIYIGDLQTQVNAANAARSQAIENCAYVQQQYNAACVELAQEKSLHSQLQIQYSDRETELADLHDLYDDVQSTSEAEITKLRQEVRLLQLQLEAAEERARQLQQPYSPTQPAANPWGQPNFEPQAQ